MVDEQAFLRALTHFAHTLAQPYDVGNALYRLSDEIVEVLGVQGAGMSVLDDGALRFVAATDDSVVRVEEHQIETGEGPCHTAMETGEIVPCEDLTGDDRWPNYSPFAQRHGWKSVAGVPMTANDEVVGALDLYRSGPHAWNPDETATASVLADMAAGYIINVRTLEESRDLAAQLQHALDSRVVIEQAKGILAEREGVDTAEAFERLRRYARGTRRRLHDVAEDVVAGRLDLGNGGPPEGPSQDRVPSG